MPFRSKAQARMMFAQHPKIAKRWAGETPSIKALPEKVKAKSVHEKAESPAVERREDRSQVPEAKENRSHRPRPLFRKK